MAAVPRHGSATRKRPASASRTTSDSIAGAGERAGARLDRDAAEAADQKADRGTGGRRGARVVAILLLKEAGLGLCAIRSLAASTDRATRHALLRPAADELRSPIAAARAALDLMSADP